MILATSSSSVFQYIVPLLAMVLYIVFSGRKEKKEHDAPVVHRAPPAAPEKTRHEVLHTDIADRQLVTAIHDKEINSEGMLKHLQRADIPVKKRRTTKARKLLKSNSSLRDAFLLQEIFRRPYD